MMEVIFFQNLSSDYNSSAKAKLLSLYQHHFYIHLLRYNISKTGIVQSNSSTSKKISVMRSLFLLLVALVTFCSSVMAWKHIGPAINPKPVNITCTQKLDSAVEEMKIRWSMLDAKCDANAAFALMYLYMTAGGRDSVKNLYYENGDRTADLILAFANRYNVAINKWISGQRTIDDELTRPWVDAFSYAASNYSSVFENIVQQMNVHINYDLAFAVYETKLPPSLQDDYDRINDLLVDGMETIADALAERYDPNFNITESIPLLGKTLLSIVVGFRNNAWKNGQHLIHSWTSIGRKAIQLMLFSQTTFVTTIMKTYHFGRGKTTEKRVAYCQAHHAPLPF